MKGKYITTKILLACLAKRYCTQNDIHVQLQETIAEHKKIMMRFRMQSSAEAGIGFEIENRQAA